MAIFKRRWLKIGSGIAASVTTIVALFALLSFNFDFKITGTDALCDGTYADPCISYINVTNPTMYAVDIYNPSGVKLKFSPDVPEYYLFLKDGRCKGGSSCAAPNGVSISGWTFIDFTNATKPVADKEYVFRFPARTTKEFLLWGLKNNPHDKVKWTFTTDKGELDPVWKAVGSYSIVYDCRTVSESLPEDRSRTIKGGCYPNSSCYPDRDQYYYEYVIVSKQVCEEKEYVVGKRSVSLKQLESKCLRTDDTLCCWDNRDGGNNVQARADQFKTIIRDGESGICVDLSDNFNVKSGRGNIKLR